MLLCYWVLMLNVCLFDQLLSVCVQFVYVCMCMTWFLTCSSAADRCFSPTDWTLEWPAGVDVWHFAHLILLNVLLDEISRYGWCIFVGKRHEFHACYQCWVLQASAVFTCGWSQLHLSLSNSEMKWTLEKLRFVFFHYSCVWKRVFLKWTIDTVLTVCGPSHWFGFI